MTKLIDSHDLVSLTEAFNMIRYDIGASREYERWQLKYPEEQHEKATIANEFLSSLSADEFTDFCIGHDVMQNEIRSRSEEAEIAWQMLNNFFHEWGEYDEED